MPCDFFRGVKCLWFRRVCSHISTMIVCYCQCQNGGPYRGVRSVGFGQLLKRTEIRVAKIVFGKRCFCHLPTTGVFDKNGETYVCILPTKTTILLVGTPENGENGGWHSSEGMGLPKAGFFCNPEERRIL